MGFCIYLLYIMLLHFHFLLGFLHKRPCIDVFSAFLCVWANHWINCVLPGKDVHVTSLLHFCAMWIEFSVALDKMLIMECFLCASYSGVIWLIYKNLAYHAHWENKTVWLLELNQLNGVLKGNQYSIALFRQIQYSTGKTMQQLD